MSSIPGGIDELEAVFDDGSPVADAGLLLAGTVMERLGLGALIDEVVRPPGSAGSGAGRKVLTLVASMSSTTAAATSCACRSTGHGPPPSPQHCDTLAACPCSSEQPARVRRDAAAHQAPPTQHRNPALSPTEWLHTH